MPYLHVALIPTPPAPKGHTNCKAGANAKKLVLSRIGGGMGVYVARILVGEGVFSPLRIPPMLCVRVCVYFKPKMGGRGGVL